MPLDVFVYGSGFGESILLIWTERDGAGTRRRAAFVDCYGGDTPDRHPALVDWKGEGSPSVALVAITHPHLDHIRNSAVVMAAAGCNADHVVWWGGLTLDRTCAFYTLMKLVLNQNGEEPALAAGMTLNLLNELVAVRAGKSAYRTAPGTPQIHAPVCGVEPIPFYSGATPHGSFEVCAFSPSIGPQTPYVEWVNAQIKSKGGVTTTEKPKRKGLANATSLGFLILYGNAQLVLGADVEHENWVPFRQFCTTKCRQPFDPVLVKASHHGSATGVHPDMWPVRRGFFGTGTTPSRHCVVTPWRKGTRNLPDPVVIEQISKAGYHVWETAPLLPGVDRTTRAAGSFIRFRVDASTRNVAVQDQRFCRNTPPVP